ncbi:hypothetical protein [Chitinophaga pinensis]|nr:hypothetical protein [Chitinophaga pinensis]
MTFTGKMPIEKTLCYWRKTSAAKKGDHLRVAYGYGFLEKSVPLEW